MTSTKRKSRTISTSQTRVNDGTSMSEETCSFPEIIIGVDTHKDTHVAAAVTTLGQVLGTMSFANNPQGFHQLHTWGTSLGVITRFGIEGTGSYGKRLTQYLQEQHCQVIEITRGNQQTRRALGKTDTIDAITAAKTLLTGDNTVIPKASQVSLKQVKEVWK